MILNRMAAFMKIYTKKGDRGETSLYRGGRIAKNAIRVEAYGIVDELNCHIGILLAEDAILPNRELLLRIQRDLFVIGADLATPDYAVKAGDQVLRLRAGSESSLESAIDLMERDLQPLSHFILPGGTAIAASVHVARAVSRRAERVVVALAQQERVNEAVLIYLNRVSDFLFVLARALNQRASVADVPWEG